MPRSDLFLSKVRHCSLLQVIQDQPQPHSDVLLPHTSPRKPDVLGARRTEVANRWLTQYNIFSLVFSWFALANLWLTFAIIIDLLPSQNLYAFGNAEVVSGRLRYSLLRSSVNQMVCADPLGEFCVQRNLLGFPGSAGKLFFHVGRELLF